MESINEKKPPEGLSLPLKSLWYDGQGNWEKAHALINDAQGIGEAWVHAYLHRKEGDAWNANYWYRRAGKAMPQQTLQAEWQALVTYFLQQEA